MRIEVFKRYTLNIIFNTIVFHIAEDGRRNIIITRLGTGVRTSNPKRQ